MKKYLFTGTALAAATFLSITNIALAGNSTTLPASTIDGRDLLPANIDIVYELNTSEKNPFEEMLISTIVNSMTTENGLGISKDEVTVLLENNIFGYGMKIPTSATNDLSAPDTYAYFYMSKDNFEKILAEAKKTSTITTENYKGFATYTGEDGTSSAHVWDNLFFFTNSKANLEAALDNIGTNNNLASNVNYQEVISHNLANSFFTAYINPQTILSGIETEGVGGTTTEAMSMLSFTGLNQDLLKAVLAEGISIAQVDTGFNMGVVVQGDKNKLLQLNLPMDKNNAIPSLYQKLSGTGLMMYSEKYMQKNWFDDLMKLFTTSTMPKELTAWKSDFKKASDIDIDTEVLPYLYGQEMFTVHKTSSLIPAFTYMMKLNDNRAGIGNLLVKLNTYITKEMQKIENESKMDFFTSSLTTVSSNSFYTYTFDLAKLMGSSGVENLDTQKMLLTLRMGVTTQGDLVISTLTDLNGMLYNGSLTSNTAFNKAFTNPNETVSEVSFFNADEFHNYITMIMDEFKAPSDFRDMLDGFLTPWHNVFMKSYADTDTVWGTAMANVDVAGLANYGTLLEKMMSSKSQYQYALPANPLSPTPKYCDVHTNDWFQPYVVDLSQNDIVKGYSDGCFHPDSNVTRAEFTKMAYEAGIRSGNITPEEIPAVYDQYEAPFKDIPLDSKEWYANTVGIAAAKSLIHGFPDGTFRPNAPIKRAEAVTILYNMSSKLQAINTIGQPIESLIQFKDIGKNDWFLAPVAAAFHYGLVNGVTTDRFEPNRNLTRAEAAKMISKLMELETQNMGM